MKYFGVLIFFGICAVCELALSNTRAYIRFYNQTSITSIKAQYTDQDCMYSPTWDYGEPFPADGLFLTPGKYMQTVVMDSKSGIECDDVISYGAFTFFYEDTPGFVVTATCQITAYQGQNSVSCAIDPENHEFVASSSTGSGWVPESTEANPIIISISYQ